MEDSSWLNKRLSHPDYNNWVKGNLILRELKIGLDPFLNDKARDLQKYVLRHVPASSLACTVCTKDDLRRGRYVCPSAGICTTLLQVINTQYTHHPPGTVKLVNTDTQAWCDKARYWEIAKAYISTPGYASKKSAAETDCAGLLTIIINCTWIQSFLAVGLAVFQQIKDVRNAMMHSEDSTMTSGELDDFFNSCVQVLQELTAHGSLARIREIKDKTLTLSDIDLPAVMFIINEIKAHQEKDSEAIVNLKVWQQLAEKRMEELAKQQNKQQHEMSQLDTRVSRQHAEHQQAMSQLDNTVSQLDTTVSQLVKRKHEEDPENKEKHKRAKDLSADQVELKNCLIEQYREQILQKEPNLWFSMKNVLQMVVSLEIREDLERWMALSREDRKKKRTSKERDGTKIKSKREIFFKGLERQYEIYLLGEAGVGKSTFCHQLIDNWCKVQDTESNNEYLRELKAFPYLFFIEARRAKKAQSVYEMIQTQNCPLKCRPILDEVFKSYPENCLVVIDGLDEWQSDTKEYQELPNVTEIKGSTILITSRQWRIEALDRELPSSCRVLEIRGLDSNGIENLADKALEAFTREEHQCSDHDSQVKQFLDQIYELELDNLARIPLILLILLRSWLNGKGKLENALGFIYSGLIESLLIHFGKKVKVSKTWGDRTNPNVLPMCFSEKSNCLDYNLLLKKFARLAFDHLFSAEKENTLVLKKYDLAKNPRLEEHLQVCLKLGLLIESKDLSVTNECHRAYTFPHKTIQEFFCAVYLSGENFETGLAKFCERVTSPVEVFEFENVVLFLSGMNLTHYKTLFECICSIVFCRKLANEMLYPVGWQILDKVEKIEKFAEHCTAEARHSVPEGSHTGESQFVIPDMVVDEDTPEHTQFVMPDMVVDKDTPEHKVVQFCRLGLNIKSLVYDGTATPFSVVESIKTMRHIQRLGIVCTEEHIEKYIVCICKYLSNFRQLKSFSFSVACSTVRLPIHVSTELFSGLSTLPNLVSVYLQQLDLSDIDTCQFTSQLTSLGLEYTESLSPGFVSGWCKQLHTLYINNVDVSPAAVRQLCQYVKTTSSLQSLQLLRHLCLYHTTVFNDMLDLTSHTLLHTLVLSHIDLKSGVSIHRGHHLRRIHMHKVSMSEFMWQEFIQNLPTKPVQQLNVILLSVKSLNTQTMSYIRDKFCITLYRTVLDRKFIQFITKH